MPYERYRCVFIAYQDCLKASFSLFAGQQLDFACLPISLSFFDKDMASYTKTFDFLSKLSNYTIKVKISNFSLVCIFKGKSTSAMQARRQDIAAGGPKTRRGATF